MTPSLVLELSWERKESLVTTACACTKISILYAPVIHGLLDHMTVYTMPAKLESCWGTIKQSFEEPRINLCSSCHFKILQAPSLADDNTLFEWKTAYHVLLVGTCTRSHYQALFSPPPKEPGDEAIVTPLFTQYSVHATYEAMLAIDYNYSLYYIINRMNQFSCWKSLLATSKVLLYTSLPLFHRFRLSLVF